MFTAGEAAAVALGLMAARRLGLETEGALAKVRRALPDRVRLPVESLEHTLGLHGQRSTPRRPTARRCSRSRTPPAAAAASARATRTPRASRPRASSSPYGVVAHRAAGTCRRTTTCAVSCARCARTGSRPCGSAARGEPVARGFDAVAFVSRTLARVPWAHEVEVRPAHGPRDRRAALPADARGARARARTACCCGSVRSRWTGRRAARRRRLLVRGACGRTRCARSLAALASRLTAA